MTDLADFRRSMNGGQQLTAGAIVLPALGRSSDPGVERLDTAGEYDGQVEYTDGRGRRR